MRTRLLTTQEEGIMHTHKKAAAKMKMEKWKKYGWKPEVETNGEYRFRSISFNFSRFIVIIFLLWICALFALQFSNAAERTTRRERKKEKNYFFRKCSSYSRCFECLPLLQFFLLSICIGIAYECAFFFLLLLFFSCSGVSYSFASQIRRWDLVSRLKY